MISPVLSVGTDCNVSSNSGDIHALLRMNHCEFGEALMYHLAPSTG